MSRSRSMSRETTSDEMEENETSEEIERNSNPTYSLDYSTVINKSKLSDTIRILEKCKNDHRYAIVPRTSLSKTCKICIDRVHNVTTAVTTTTTTSTLENNDASSCNDGAESKGRTRNFYEKLPLHPKYAFKIRQTIVKRIFILFACSVAALATNVSSSQTPNPSLNDDDDGTDEKSRASMKRESITLLATYRCCGIVASFLSAVLDPILLEFFKELPSKMKGIFDDMYVRLGYYTDNHVISELARLFDESTNDAAWKNQEKLVLKCFI